MKHFTCKQPRDETGGIFRKRSPDMPYPNHTRLPKVDHKHVYTCVRILAIRLLGIIKCAAVNTILSANQQSVI